MREGRHRVDNPATGEVIGTIPRLGATDTRNAIDAAARGLPASLCGDTIPEHQPDKRIVVIKQPIGS
jgi:hypothetical protein